MSDYCSNDKNWPDDKNGDFSNNYLIVPPEQLSADALQGVIEEFITREGTDYGEIEFLLADKVQQVRALLRTAAVKIIYDLRTETCTLMTKEEIRQLEISAS